MSKLRQLIENPALFIEKALTKGKVPNGKLGPVEEVRRRLAPVDGESPFITAFLESIQSSTEYFTTPTASGDEHLNCFAEDIAWVIYRAAIHAEKHKGRLLVYARRSTMMVDRREVANVTKTLTNVNRFELIFRRSPEQEENVAVMVWERRGDHGEIYCRTHNLYARTISTAFFDAEHRDGKRRVDLSKRYAFPIDSECGFEIDFVFAWADPSDPESRKLEASGKASTGPHVAADVLRHSLRSVHVFAPWVRRIHVVSPSAPPSWVEDHPKLEWVKADLLCDDELATFNPHALESCLMHIEGLTEHFVCMTGNIFLGMPAQKQTFFASNGVSLSFLDPCGGVVGDADSARPDSTNAAINGRRLIEKTFGVSPTQLHLPAPHAVRKSVLLEIEERFPEEIARTRRAPCPSTEDVAVVSFLYHHYAFQTRYALPSPTATAVDVTNDEASEQALWKKRRRFFSVDSGAIAHTESFQERTLRFLARYFPEQPPWESG